MCFSWWSETGERGAPATFQRMMDEVLHDMGTFTADYIDDIVILYDSYGTSGRCCCV